MLAGGTMTLTVNRKIARIPHLDAFLAEHPRAVAGWGRKRSGRIARVLAWLLRRPCLLLEDGFLRSVAHDGPLLSLLIDDISRTISSLIPFFGLKTGIWSSDQPSW